MGLSLSKSPESHGAASGASLRDRLRAWWHGYEIAATDDFDEAYALRDVPGSGENTVAEETPARDGKPDIVFARDHLDLCQTLWGEGFLFPGGASYVQDLTASCMMNAAETLLQVGIGLGGEARTVIGKFGNYITAYEQNADLAAEAEKLSVKHDLQEKLKINVCPLDEIDPKKGYFRAAFVREALSGVENRDGTLKKICAALKRNDAHLILTDLFHDGESMTPETEAWSAGERTAVFPWRIEDLKKLMEANGVAARIVRDDSDDYCAMATAAWSKFLSEFSKRDTLPEFRELVAEEADYWNRRIAALQSGGLRYYRVQGLKNA